MLKAAVPRMKAKAATMPQCSCGSQQHAPQTRPEGYVHAARLQDKRFSAGSRWRAVLAALRCCMASSGHVTDMHQHVRIWYISRASPVTCNNGVSTHRYVTPNSRQEASEAARPATVAAAGAVDTKARGADARKPPATAAAPALTDSVRSRSCKAGRSNHGPYHRLIREEKMCRDRWDRCRERC